MLNLSIKENYMISRLQVKFIMTDVIKTGKNSDLKLTFFLLFLCISKTVKSALDGFVCFENSFQLYECYGFYFLP